MTSQVFRDYPPAVKVLIIKLGALGDVVMASPMIRKIQDSHAGAEIWLLTTPPFLGVFKGWPKLRVRVLPRKGLRAMLQTVCWIRGMQFEVVYDLQSNDRTTLMLALSGIPRRVGNLTHFPYTHHPPTTYRCEIHIFERMNQVLESARLGAASPTPWLPITQEGREKVAAWLAEKNLGDGAFVVMHAHASAKWQSKCWPYFGQLARNLEDRGYRVVWAGAGTDAQGNAELAKLAGIDATDHFSINELAELGRHAHFAVTNDSGPMHVLSCADIPVYAFFGPTSVVQSHAIGNRDRVLMHPVSCSPCYLPVCPAEKRHACLDNLSLEQVIERLASDGLI